VVRTYSIVHPKPPALLRVLVPGLLRGGTRRYALGGRVNRLTPLPVGIKALRAGLPSPRAVARERGTYPRFQTRAFASLRHQALAQLYATGLTPNVSALKKTKRLHLTRTWMLG